MNRRLARSAGSAGEETAQSGGSSGHSHSGAVEAAQAFVGWFGDGIGLSFGLSALAGDRIQQPGDGSRGEGSQQCRAARPKTCAA